MDVELGFRRDNDYLDFSFKDVGDGSDEKVTPSTFHSAFNRPRSEAMKSNEKSEALIKATVNMKRRLPKAGDDGKNKPFTKVIKMGKVFPFRNQVYKCSKHKPNFDLSMGSVHKM